MSASTRKRGSSLEGRKFRFVVQSAEEAVKTIREQLGENARVLSVEQVGGKGLAKFLSSPQLEVIATVPTKAELEREKAEKLKNAAAEAQGAVPQTEGAPAPQAGSRSRRGRSRTRIPRASRKQASAAAANANTAAPAAALPDVSKEREKDKPLTPSGKETLESLLKKANFDEDLLRRMEDGTDWKSISKMQLNHGLSEVFYWLKEEYRKLVKPELAQRIAFMGTSGCGKTTALCKRMATDVIVHGKKVQVLKVEGEAANPDDTLRVLCRILNVELLHDPIDLERVDPDGYLYVDVPGISLNEDEQWRALSKRLDELWIESRVLVLNAAYERDVLKVAIHLGTQAGCTHQVFTHLDELSNVTKLWEFILGSGLGTLFFSYGQNVTSEFSSDVLGFLTSRTFPSYLTK